MLWTGAPHHLTAIRTALAAFPEARVVMPHRDPVRTVVSWCSLCETLSAACTDRLDRARLGGHWSRRIARNLADFVAARDALGPERFIDVHYEALTREPVATTLRVLAALDIGPAPEDEARIAAWIARNGRDRRAPHRYDAARFGLSEDGLATLFADYKAGFAV